MVIEQDAADGLSLRGNEPRVRKTSKSDSSRSADLCRSCITLLFQSTYYMLVAGLVRSACIPIYQVQHGRSSVEGLCLVLALSRAKIVGATQGIRSGTPTTRFLLSPPL